MNFFYWLELKADNAYRKRFQRKIPPPSYVIWDSTRRCNLHCEHCGASKEKYDDELKTVEVMSVIDELSQAKVRMFAITGGEPLVRKDMIEIIDYAAGKGMKTGIATNGYFVKSLVSKLKNLYSAQISIDGPEEVHNKIRGNSNSYARAVEAAELLKNIPLLQIATTVTKSNIGHLGRLKEILISMRVKMWRLSIVMPIGRATSNLYLTKSEMIQLFEFMKSVKGIRIYMAENLPYLGRYEKLRSGPVRCPVGITACCIGVNGSVRGCPEQPDTKEFIEGNIKDSSFSDIWEKGFKRYRNNDLCPSCKAREICLGGCHVMRLGNRHCIKNLIA